MPSAPVVFNVMPSERRTLKVAAVAYLAAASVAAAWAWYIDFSLLGSQREHLLPDLLLMVFGIPLSLLAELIYEHWPQFFSGLVQTAFLAACALVQSGLLAAFAFRRLRDAKA